MPEKRPVTAEDLYRISQIEDPQFSPDGRWIAFVRVTVDKMGNGYHRNIWLIDRADHTPSVQLTRGNKDTSPRWSPDGTQLAFVSARADRPQVYVLRVAAPGGEARVVTKMETGAGAPAWSPDGRQIAFLCSVNAEERAREDSGESDEPPRDELEQKHRKERKEHDEKERWDPSFMWRIPYRAGTSFLTDRYAQIYVTDAASADESAGSDTTPGGAAAANQHPGTVDRSPGGPHAKRLTNTDADHGTPRWSADGQSIYTTRAVDPNADEPFRERAVFRVSVETGESERASETGYTYFDVKISPDGSNLAMIRVRNTDARSLLENVPELVVQGVEDGVVTPVAAELDRSIAAFDWAADSRSLTFAVESEGFTPLLRATLQATAMTTVCEGALLASALSVASDGSVAFAASTPVAPTELWLAGAGVPAGPGDSHAGAGVPAGARRLTDFNRSWLDEVIVQEPHELWFETPSGNRIQGWYLLPVGYEDGAHYPLALNIHGGPHVMWSSAMPSMFHEWQFHAASGYVAFFCNPRGSAGYGEAFQHALHKAWGDVAYEDIMAGVETLLARGFVDDKRMAITGGSYGGYMTAWIIGHTDRFAAAVSQRGVYNLSSFYGTSDVPSLISGEFDAEPWEEPEVLWHHSPLAYAHKIKTPTLILHSENDYRVPIEQAEQLFAFIRRSGGTVEMWRYPRDGHELSRSGEPKHRQSRLERMVEWFDRHCASGR